MSDFHPNQNYPGFPEMSIISILGESEAQKLQFARWPKYFETPCIAQWALCVLNKQEAPSFQPSKNYFCSFQLTGDMKLKNISISRQHAASIYGFVCLYVCYVTFVCPKFF